MGVDPLAVELREVIVDHVPASTVLGKDVFVGAQSRVVVQHAGRDLDELPIDVGVGEPQTWQKQVR